MHKKHRQKKGGDKDRKKGPHKDSLIQSSKDSVVRPASIRVDRLG